MVRWPVDFNTIFGYDEDLKIEKSSDTDVENERALEPDRPNEMDDFLM